MRTLASIGLMAAAHLLVTLGLGVLTFISQGPLDRPEPPGPVHRALSATVDVLEFPGVWAVRRLDRERLRGFEAAAVGNSLLWGAGLVLALRGARRRPMMRAMVVLSLLLAGLAGPALAGPDRPIADVKSLAGDWRAVGGTSPAAIRIKPDGSYEGLAASGAKTTGKVAVTAGKGTYWNSSSEGTVTLSTEGGKDVLTFMRADRKGSARLERVK